MPTTTNRPFLANFLAAFRARSSPAFPAKSSPSSSTATSTTTAANASATGTTTHGHAHAHTLAHGPGGIAATVAAAVAASASTPPPDSTAPYSPPPHSSALTIPTAPTASSAPAISPSTSPAPAHHRHSAYPSSATTAATLQAAAHFQAARSNPHSQSHSASPIARSPVTVPPANSFHHRSRAAAAVVASDHRGVSRGRRRGSDSSASWEGPTSAGSASTAATATSGSNASAFDKWYIGGRTAGGEETFYKLGMVKRYHSNDKLSLDRLSLESR